MKFLSAIRSDEEHAAMREHLLVCHCKPAIRVFHRPVCRPHAEVLELVLFEICLTISEYFHRLGPAKFRKRKSNVSPEAQPWPGSITDIIPSPGAEHDVLVALVQWACLVPGGHSVFALIGALARFWEPFASLLFLAPGVFFLATKHMQHALGAHDPNAEAAVQLNSFVSPIVACAQGLFHTLLDMDMLAMTNITGNIYNEMHALAVRIEPILATPAMRARICDDCRRYFDFVRSMRAVMEPDGTRIKRDEAKIVREMEPSTHYIGAFMQMLEIRNRNQCLHIECMEPVLGRAAICSRCGIVRFCTRECLAAAWAAPHLPHKTLCKAIQRLRVATLLTEDAAWNRTVRDGELHRSPVKFAEACMTGSVDPRIAEAVWQGITFLTQEKDKFAAKMEQAAAEAGKEQEEVGNSEEDRDEVHRREEVKVDPTVEYLNHLRNLQIDPESS
ncbi:hypothetical protein B0H13DRAFT_2419882 [Mycena leptocephala]|nr:hypothetical protein B0H13DRAFT_2419882 [Mycena leptocephala]